VICNKEVNKNGYLVTLFTMTAAMWWCDYAIQLLNNNLMVASLNPLHVLYYLVTSFDLLHWCSLWQTTTCSCVKRKKRILGIFYSQKLKTRFVLAKTAKAVKGTLHYHRFVPVSQSTMQVFKLSAQSKPPELVQIQDPSNVDGSNDDSQIPLEIKGQNFVCCLYDGLLWIGLVDEVSEEFGDYNVKFMHSHGPSRQFHWPSKAEIPERDILCVINTPSLISSSSRNYSICQNDLVRISKVWSAWIVDNE